MRFKLASLAVLVAFAVPAVYADTYTLSLTPSGGSTTSYALNTSSGFYFPVDFVFLNTTATTGTATSIVGRIDLLNPTAYSGFDLTICPTGNGGGCSGTVSQYTGVQLDIDQNTLNVGTFQLVDHSTSLSATVSIVDNSSIAATPEPSSIALLGTGVLGLAGMVRRRINL